MLLPALSPGSKKGIFAPSLPPWQRAERGRAVTPPPAPRAVALPPAPPSSHPLANDKREQTVSGIYESFVVINPRSDARQTKLQTRGSASLKIIHLLYTLSNVFSLNLFNVRSFCIDIKLSNYKIF